ncbi:ABC transporter substrate-binding protein [Halopelagius longus]|uniref:ABC transporter substrate-binding protein n=1 Tax=Halopelagius longus TaxID=1236180 RepID=A0A1H1E0G2_9EURY|nr:ABC transporter substrate-binding protein [Halopelagius longus]RDI71547.1 ABC transporter substrate-binding protein [Halopelagius longus]SDQ82123.1 peptide/nickel transport system substrate-binding protein [Halopelagius longus]
MTDENWTPTLGRRDALKGIAVAAGAALSGCSAEAVPGNDPGEQLRYSMVLPPVTLDPVETTDAWSAKAENLVFQGLYAYDREMNRVPVLASGSPTVSDDGRTYTVSLTEGATFADGSDVTAADVKYTFEAPIAEESPNAWQVEMLEAVETPDERTVRFELSHPYPAFEHALTRKVVPKGVREGNETMFGKRPDSTVGSGPYDPAVFKRGKYVRLERRGDVWGERSPAVERVKLINTHAGLARTMALKTGQSDVVERIQPKLWEATRKMPNVSIVQRPSFSSYFLAFNCGAEPTADPKVREAVDYLVSMDEFVEHIVGEGGERQPSPLPNRLAEAWNFPLGEWAGVQHDKNVEEAKALFEEAGVKNWSPKIVVPHNDKMREKLANAVAHGLKNAGFRRARVVKHHWEKFRETVTSGNRDEYAMYVGSWAGGPDPDTYLYPLFHWSQEDATNGTFYHEESVMRRLRRARRTTDRERRRTLYERTITTLLEDRVVLPAFTLDNSFGVKRRVRDFEAHPMAQYNPRLVGGRGSDAPVRLRE